LILLVFPEGVIYKTIDFNSLILTLTRARERSPSLKKKVYTGLVELRPDAIKKQNARKGIREKIRANPKQKKSKSEGIKKEAGRPLRYVLKRLLCCFTRVLYFCEKQHLYEKVCLL
jgi:hypothetical protein